MRMDAKERTLVNVEKILEHTHPPLTERQNIHPGDRVQVMFNDSTFTTVWVLIYAVCSFQYVGRVFTPTTHNRMDIQLEPHHILAIVRGKDYT